MSIKPLAMRDVFIERIWRSMAEDRQVFFTCADFGSPVLDKVRADFPDRFVNVGIAEQNLINVSAGLALEGFTVFAYAIAPFITMRCYEQVRVSLALLSEVRPMNVNLIGVGAGYSYVVSGPTHQCYEDITLMRALPNFQVLSPADHVTTAALFDGCLQTTGPKYLRLTHRYFLSYTKMRRLTQRLDSICIEQEQVFVLSPQVTCCIRQSVLRMSLPMKASMLVLSICSIWPGFPLTSCRRPSRHIRALSA